MADTLFNLILERVRREFPDGDLRYPDSMIRQFCHVAYSMGEDLLELNHSSTTYNLTTTNTWYDLPERCISIESVALIHPGETTPRGVLKPIFEDDMHDSAYAWDDSVGPPRIYMLRSCPGIPGLPDTGTVSKIRFWPTVESNDGYQAVVSFISHTEFTDQFTGGLISEWLVDIFFMPFVRMLMAANGKRRGFVGSRAAFQDGIMEARSMMVNPINDPATGYHGFKG